MIKRTLLIVSMLVIGIIDSFGQPSTMGAFKPMFTVLYSAEDPDLAMRPGGIRDINYNVATWKTYPGKQSDLPLTQKDAATAGDGFDEGILEGKSSGRTVNQHNAAQAFHLVGEVDTQRGDTTFFSFPAHDHFLLTAYYVKNQETYPQLRFHIEAKQPGWFSVGYTGAPGHGLDEVAEIWQPLIWQEKRFPDKPYLTLAYRCPIPSALVQYGENTIGVLAAAAEFPFEPLPQMQNSRFGVSVRNGEGDAQPQLWAPVLGGVNSYLKPGTGFGFTCLLPVIDQPLTFAYEEIARQEFQFSDFRRNEISNLNETLERMVDYALSDHAWFVDSLKGCAYATDVPGAVKNVSSLNPLNLALVMDDQRMFDERGYPILEYMLSREKFLFSLDPEQKIQSPSRKLAGPVAPISELTALYSMFGKTNSFFLDLAQCELTKKRIRNLDVEEDGGNWINAMHIYKATGERAYLQRATAGADRYIADRVSRRQEDFGDPFAGAYFFWPSYTARWIELLELYEATGEPRYRDAARDGARHYVQFCWMSPAVPDREILVNEGGKAPHYWYLKSKGHKQMETPEEQVPAWRVSEIGLTAESSGTSTGHRAIFMANYAPWLLRLGYYTDDRFLQEVARNAMVGRYRNFPGYHMNTARTTVYEKADYPLRPHEELSMNSFHYNHILPMASMLLDFLVTDAFVKSKGRIDFPSDYIEGYAYLQNKMYGSRPGTFEGETGVHLWMPAGLLDIDDVELNYLSARKDGKLYLAFMNQSDRAVATQVRVSEALIPDLDSSRRSFAVEVAPGGIKTVVLENVPIQPAIQDKLVERPENGQSDNYLEIPVGRAKAMLMRFGDYVTKAFLYLSDDDSNIRSATVRYRDASGKEHLLVDKKYPFEFTMPVDGDGMQLELEIEDRAGSSTSSGPLWLGAKTDTAKSEEGEERLSLNGRWAFRTVQTLEEAPPLAHPDTAWQAADSLTVPGNWDTEVEYAQYRGLGMYRKEISVPASWKGGIVRLRFEAVYETAHVYINGHYVGSHKGGYTPFEFRADDLLKWEGTNTIAVVADNTYGRGAWWAWGGISRDVSLVRNHNVRINKLWVTPKVDLQTRKGKVDIQYRVENNSAPRIGNERSSAKEVSIRVFKDATYGRAVVDTTYSFAGGDGEQLVSIQLPDSVELWQIDHPHRYSCEVSIVENGRLLHHRRTAFGFRTIERRGQQLLLNGESVRLLGFNRVHDHRAAGNTEPFWLIKNDLDHMKSLGCNMTRMMHAPLAPELLEYADRIGMLIIQEIPVWGREDPQAFEDNPTTKQWLQELIHRDYNHPSVIGWSVSNELVLDLNDWRSMHMSREQYQYVKSMIKYVKAELDTTRLVTYVSLSAFREGITPDTEPAEDADIICFNNYGNFVEAAERVHQRWPDKPVFVTEFGQGQIGGGADDTLRVEVIDRLDSLAKLPYIVGASLWSYNDYRSDYEGTPLGGDRTWGIVDVWRNPKQAVQQIRAVFAPIAGMATDWDTRQRRFDIRLSPRNEADLPAYTLRGYQLVLVLYDKGGVKVHVDSLSLPDIQPGGADLDRAFIYPVAFSKVNYARLLLKNRMGHVVYERVLYRNVPEIPQLENIHQSDSVVRLQFKPFPPETSLCIVVPGADTIRSTSRTIDVPRVDSAEHTQLIIHSANHQGLGKPLKIGIRFTGAPLPPMIRAVISVNDGMVVGYTTRAKNSQYTIQYQLLQQPDTRVELVTTLEGATKIPLAIKGRYEVRIKERTDKVDSQWSPWQQAVNNQLAVH